jgi:predicted HTH domain antitoxin
MEQGISKEGSMTTVTITIPEELSTQLGPYQDKLDELLRIGLSEMKKTQALSLFKKGNISLWKVARLAGVSLREMTEYAVSQGLRAMPDEETEREELA